MPLSSLIVAIITIAYPALVYIGLTRFEPRSLGALLLVVLLLRHGRHVALFWQGMPRVERLLLALMLLLSIAIMIANQEWLLRLYPATMSFGVFAVFARSLWRPPTVIERFARLKETDLHPEGVAYTRRVTEIWCIFLAINGVIAFASIFASREWWALWNGLLSYLCMGVLFAGEWLVRRRFRQQHRLSA